MSDRRALLVPLGLLLAYGLAQIHWGEAIEVTGGLGFYDGRRYGEIAMDFPGQVFRQGVDAYRLQRVLPSAIVHLWLRATGQPLDAIRVRDSFRFYNLLMLLLTAATWAGIAREMGLDGKGFWLGLSLLFLNFANLKMPFYNAVLTDTTALALGALVLYFYLRGSGPGLLTVLALAAFTWPPLLAGALLYVFPRHEGPRDLSLMTKGSVALGAIATLVCAGVLAGHADVFAQRPRPWLTAAVLLAYCFLTQASLLHVHWSALRGRLRGWRLLQVAALVVAVTVVVTLLSPGAKGFTVGRYLREIVFYTSLQPALFLVAHAVYFGMVVCLMLACWPLVSAAALRLGTGMTLYVAVQLAQAIDPETRHITPALPAFVLLAVMAASAVRWPTWVVWATAVVGTLGSKAWWPINQGEFGSYLEPPLQYYYMNHGGAMSPASYRLQGAIVAVVTLATLVLARHLASRLRAAPPARSDQSGEARSEAAGA